MPARPFRMPDSVLRLTPSARAVSVTVRFNGFRHNTLSTSPGCGGLCIFMVTSMVVLVVYVIYVLAGTDECDAPVAAHRRRSSIEDFQPEFCESLRGVGDRDFAKILRLKSATWRETAVACVCLPPSLEVEEDYIPFMTQTEIDQAIIAQLG